MSYDVSGPVTEIAGAGIVVASIGLSSFLLYAQLRVIFVAQDSISADEFETSDDQSIWESDGAMSIGDEMWRASWRDFYIEEEIEAGNSLEFAFETVMIEEEEIDRALEFVRAGCSSSEALDRVAGRWSFEAA